MNAKLIQKFLIIITIFCVTPCLSQTTIPKSKLKKCEKILKKAIENGKNSNGVYTTQEVRKLIPYIPSYLRQKGYASVSISEGKVWKFFEFVNKNELADYMCRKYLPNYKSYTKDCYWHYYPWEFKQDNYHNKGSIMLPFGVAVSPETVTTFPICWSGKTTGRRIEGEGIGYHIYGDALYIYDNGYFVNGFPIYVAGTDMREHRINVRKIIWDGEQIRDLGSLSMIYFFSEEIKRLMRHKDDGPIAEGEGPVSEDILTQQDAKAYFIRLEYKEWCNVIEKRYHELENIAKRVDNGRLYDRDSIIVGERNTTYLVELLDKSRYDPEQIKPKALEILNIIKVLKARNFLHWDRTKPLDKSFLEDALVCARKGSTLNRGINDFYKKSISILEQDIADYYTLTNRYWENKIRDEEEARAERNLKSSGEIDWSRSYEPSGKLESTRGLFSTTGGYKYEKDGRLFTKRGHSIFYNKLYNSSKEFDKYYVSTGFGRMKTFYKSKDEMIRDFLDAAKNNP